MNQTLEHDSTRLVGLAVTTAVHLLEVQDGLLFPIAHAIDASDRCVFIGAYSGDVTPHPLRALHALRNSLRQRAFRSSAITYAIELADGTGRYALCIEFESSDAAAETTLVPFVITRPGRAARVVTYAAIRAGGATAPGWAGK